MREKTVVNTRDLIALVENFETLDADARAMYPGEREANINQQLSYAIIATYHHSKNTEYTLMTIMDTLIPLMEENQKMQEIKRGLR